MVRKPQRLLLLLVLPVLVAFCQAQVSPSDVEARVDSLLKKLILDEKIDLIGG